MPEPTKCQGSAHLCTKMVRSNWKKPVRSLPSLHPVRLRVLGHSSACVHKQARTCMHTHIHTHTHLNRSFFIASHSRNTNPKFLSGFQGPPSTGLQAGNCQKSQLGPHRAKCSVQTGNRQRRKLSMGENGCSVLFPHRQSIPENAQQEHGQTLLRCGETRKSQKHKRVRKKATSLPAPSHQMLSTRSRSLARYIWFQLPVPQPQPHRAGTASLV